MHIETLYFTTMTFVVYLYQNKHFSLNFNDWPNAQLRFLPFRIPSNPERRVHKNNRWRLHQFNKQKEASVGTGKLDFSIPADMHKENEREERRGEKTGKTLASAFLAGTACRNDRGKRIKNTGWWGISNTRIFPYLPGYVLNMVGGNTEVIYMTSLIIWLEEKKSLKRLRRKSWQQQQQQQ